MTCQQIIESSRTETSESDVSLSRPCGKPVRQWRECGNGKADGCTTVVAFCDEHGGFDRATEEMAGHMVMHRIVGGRVVDVVDLETVEG